MIALKEQLKDSLVGEWWVNSRSRERSTSQIKHGLMISLFTQRPVGNYSNLVRGTVGRECPFSKTIVISVWRLAWMGAGTGKGKTLRALNSV